jgi:hypothetical protein
LFLPLNQPVEYKIVSKDRKFPQYEQLFIVPLVLRLEAGPALLAPAPLGATRLKGEGLIMVHRANLRCRVIMIKGMVLLVLVLAIAVLPRVATAQVEEKEPLAVFSLGAAMEAGLPSQISRSVRGRRVQRNQ